MNLQERNSRKGAETIQNAWLQPFSLKRLLPMEATAGAVTGDGSCCGVN